MIQKGNMVKVQLVQAHQGYNYVWIYDEDGSLKTWKEPIIAWEMHVNYDVESGSSEVYTSPVTIEGKRDGHQYGDIIQLPSGRFTIYEDRSFESEEELLAYLKGPR